MKKRHWIGSGTVVVAFGGLGSGSLNPGPVVGGLLAGREGSILMDFLISLTTGSGLYAWP